MAASSVFIGELSWPEYDQLVRGGATVLLPVGALEQHGHHLPMNVDVLLPTALCRRVAERVDGLVAPAIPYGYKSQQRSGGGNHLPGTTSLDGATLTATIRDILRELARHGVRRVAIVNGHFENSWFIIEGIDLALRELRADRVEDMQVMTLSYWDFLDDSAVLERLYPNGATSFDLEHGGILETSLMLSLHPELVRLEALVDHSVAVLPPYDLFPVVPERTPAPGTLSSGKEATRDKGDLIARVCVDGMAAALRDEWGSGSS